MAQFYSQWYYSAIRLMTAVPGYQTPEEISKYLDLPISQINRVLQFLVTYGLCLQENGFYHIGPNSTHVHVDDPLVTRHHINWRLRSIERFNFLTPSEFCLTLPNAISDKYIKMIRKELLEVTTKITSLVDESPAENLTCLNIDFFKVISGTDK